MTNSDSAPVTPALVHFTARHLLAALLIWLGMYKLFPTTFLPPEPLIWIRPYGEQSLCELMHTWVGFGPKYVVALGAADLVAATMLLFQRTTTFGAIVGTICLIDIVLLNLGYSCGIQPAIPALIGVALGAYLMHMDRKRILDFLIRNRATRPCNLEPVQPSTRTRVAVRVVGALVLFYPAFVLPLQRWIAYQPISPIAGMYRVQSFTRNGVLEPLIYEKPDRWMLVAIDRHARTAAVRTLGDARLQLDATNLQLVMQDSSNYQLRAVIERDTITATLKRLDPIAFEFSANYGLGYQTQTRRWGYR